MRIRLFLLLADWSVQLLIAVIGILYLVDDEDFGWLLLWCGLGTIYAFAAIVTLALGVRTSQPERERVFAHMPSHWFARLRRVIAFTLTAVPTAIGVTAALQVILAGGDKESGSIVKLVGVWAMLLAWGFLHWGFAQAYAAAGSDAAPAEVFSFPGSTHPSLVDYVYFAYTVGTTFAASDVSVLSTRMRWLVTVQSVLGFFINALIIALSFNTITSAGDCCTSR